MRARYGLSMITKCTRCTNGRWAASCCQAWLRCSISSWESVMWTAVTDVAMEQAYASVWTVTRLSAEMGTTTL